MGDCRLFSVVEVSPELSLIPGNSKFPAVAVPLTPPLRGDCRLFSVAEVSPGLSLITGSSESPVVAVLLTQPLTMEGQ